MTPLKVGEPFLGDQLAIPSQAGRMTGRCRDWTGGTYSASQGEGTVQTTNACKGGGESRSGRLIRGLWVRSPQGPPYVRVARLALLPARGRRWLLPAARGDHLRHLRVLKATIGDP